MYLPTSHNYCPMVVFFLGVVSHLYYFRIGEHDLYSVHYLQSAIAFPIIGTVGVWMFSNIDLIKAATLIIQYQAMYICSIWVSMLIYRISPYHRLFAFPGEMSWKLTKFTQCWKNRSFGGFRVLDELHQTYGEYVRTGN